MADCNALADIAAVLGKAPEEQALRARGERYAAKLQTLWDEKTGMFLERNLDTGEFIYRLSPTNFYPMLGKVATPRQADRMVNEHLLNPGEFWGDWVLPSISRSCLLYTSKDGTDFARTVPPVNWRLLARHKEISIVDVRPRLSMDDGLKPFAQALLVTVREGYVCAYLDEFYLKGSPTYGKWHNKHETLICGYDAAKNALALAFYGSDGRFALVDMDLGHAVASFASIKGWPRQWTCLLYTSRCV